MHFPLEIYSCLHMRRSFIHVCTCVEVSLKYRYKLNACILHNQIDSTFQQVRCCYIRMLRNLPKTCNICFKTMRGDNLKRHMLKHVNGRMKKVEEKECENKDIFKLFIFKLFIFVYMRFDYTLNHSLFSKLTVLTLFSHLRM